MNVFFKALFLLTLKFSLYYIFHVRPILVVHFMVFFSLTVLLKEMAIILNLQHAKDDIEIIFIFVLVKTL